jgi:predicted kinase
VLRERIEARTAAQDDLSEADLAVLNSQLAAPHDLGTDERTHAVTVATAGTFDVEQLAARVRRLSAVDAGAPG